MKPEQVTGVGLSLLRGIIGQESPGDLGRVRADAREVGVRFRIRYRLGADADAIIRRAIDSDIGR